MICLFTATGLTPGSSSTVHTYTQAINRTTQSTQTVHKTTQLTNWEECGPCPVFTSYTLLPEFATMVIGHGKLRSYFHRSGLIDNPKCPCEEEKEQTTNHLTFQCKKLRNQRNEMTKQIKNTCGNWSTTNETLVKNYLQIFVNFVISINFTDL